VKVANSITGNDIGGLGLVQVMKITINKAQENFVSISIYSLCG
jgi:hypothetical protein